MLSLFVQRAATFSDNFDVGPERRDSMANYSKVIMCKTLYNYWNTLYVVRTYHTLISSGKSHCRIIIIVLHC